MVDDVKDITETAESKVSTEALDRARLAREKREAEQRKRLEELRAHAAAAQAQREKRDEERRRRQAEQRARDEDRRHQVEERKRAIWEASISRREALLQREKDREERLERSRASRSGPRPAFAFGSSTPRLLEPVDTTGFFWAARSTNPIDQMNFFEASSTTNVMFASAPLTRRASALQLDSENENKDEPDRQPQAVMWSSVARRRTDLVPTIPASRGPEVASGASTPGSRPGSALSSCAPVVRRATPRRPRPASIAGTGVNTPRGGVECQSTASTPMVSRDASSTSMAVAAADVPRRPATTPRRPRPASMHAKPVSATTTPAEGKPPLHRKPKLSKEQDKANRGLSLSISPSPAASKEPSVDKEIVNKQKAASKPSSEKSQVNASEVTQKLEALQIQNETDQHGGHNQNIENKQNETQEVIETNSDAQTHEIANVVEQTKEEKPTEAKEIERKEEKERDNGEKFDESEMTASMTARRITTEEQAKAALAERRRKAREELERQAELERQRLQREAEEEAERQRLEEERQRREEEEARELARLQRQMEEEKLRKAIEAQQQLEREEAERKAREEAEKQARIKEEEEKRKALEEELRLKREEAEREEKERLVRKQRVEAIMARTRMKKAEEDKKAASQASQAQGEAPPAPPTAPAPAQPLNNGNPATADMLGLDSSLVSETSKVESESKPASDEPSETQQPTQLANNGNDTADLLGLSEQTNTEDKIQEPITPSKTQLIDNAPIAPTIETNNGNVQHPANVGHISANFIQTERQSAESQQPKLAENLEDFITHNGHGTHNHPLTLQNAI